ncbi:unnamed protein product [Timema podura]|uniref:Uncharacterized protein n=1 Tax=Timema podura TaxID=61482 RepID=A0ABN7NQV2_TIMPD|nr:unnamed protein product [Timema podura]
MAASLRKQIDTAQPPDLVSEIHFHPERPEHLFTCSLSGEFWHWNTTSMVRSSQVSSISDLTIEENPWLSSESAKHRLEVTSLMPQLHKPVNSFDVNKTRAVCGCDNEAVYMFTRLNVVYPGIQVIWRRRLGLNPAETRSGADKRQETGQVQNNKRGTRSGHLTTSLVC